MPSWIPYFENARRIVNDMKRLLHEQDSVTILPAHAILEVGPGEETVAGQRSDGVFVVGKRKRAFRMACQHYITTLSELGGSCAWCSLIAASRGDPRAEHSSLICKACETRCSFQYCGQVLCKKHSCILPIHGANTETPLPLCPLHLTELEADTLFSELVEKHGKLAASATQYLKSVFIDDPPSLP